MTITVGRIVHFYTPDQGPRSNDCIHGPYPAIVTRVWGQFCVNLKVLPDGAEPYDVTSVTHEDQASESLRHEFWMWPPRVEAQPVKKED